MSTVTDVIARRAICEVQHFTTNRGLTGILATHSVLSRKRLPEEKYVEHVFRPNASTRKDVDWLDFVNLSVSRINASFLGASERWARNAADDVWWCVLSFAPEIMTHDGVHFATTNNFYSGVRRAAGAEGLEALFAPRVHQYLGHYAERTADMPDQYPTCRQAEVLYPGALDTVYLRAVYTITEIHADIAGSIADTVDHPPVQVEVRPDVFV